MVDSNSSNRSPMISVLTSRSIASSWVAPGSSQCLVKRPDQFHYLTLGSRLEGLAL